MKLRYVGTKVDGEWGVKVCVCNREQFFSLKRLRNIGVITLRDLCAYDIKSQLGRSTLRCGTIIER